MNGDEARHFVQLSCHCQFFRKYRLPCRHIFYADTIWSGTITEDHWKQFAWLFDESGFEIYETWASIDCPDDVFDEEMGVPARRKLAMWEVLEQVRVNFFGLEEALVSQELALEDVNKLMEGWIRSLQCSNASIIRANVDALIAGEDLDSQAVDSGSATGSI